MNNYSLRYTFLIICVNCLWLYQTEGSRARTLGPAASKGSTNTGSGDVFGGGQSRYIRNICTDYCSTNPDSCSGEHKVKEKLMCGYDRTSRPVMDDGTQIRVHIAVALFHILDTDEKHQTFTALLSVRLRWRDEHLMWNPDDYNGTSALHIPSSSIWTPDIVISNSADDASRNFLTTNTIVWHNGSVLWMFPAVVKVTCTLNVKHFPFDRQTCLVTFISWTYHLYEVDIWHDEEVDSNKNYYIEDNQEWNVTNIAFTRTVDIYACCKEPWPDVTFRITMQRRSLFYVFNLIFPCLLMYAASFLGFFLPTETGEKVNLELTILLALVVFLLIIGDTLPPTPDAIPLVGFLFGITMLMVSIALVMGVIVTNIHIRKFTETATDVPHILKMYVRHFHCAKCRRINKRSPLSLHRSSSRFISSLVLQEDTTKMQPRQNGQIKTTQDDDYETQKCLTKIPSHLSLQDYKDSTIKQLPSSGLRNNRCSISQSNGVSKVANQLQWGQSSCLCNSPDVWVVIARTVDRLFFWLFLLASLIVLSYTYSQVPHYSDDPECSLVSSTSNSTAMEHDIRRQMMNTHKQTTIPRSS